MLAAAWPRWAASLGAAFFLFGLAGCAGMNDPERFGGSRQAVVDWAAAHAFTADNVTARPFRLLSLRRGTASATATVYIEGDGRAWPGRFQPPGDPTPERPLSLLLANADPSPLVLYLGRPCQYLDPVELKDCSVRYWITHRFADEVIQSYTSALDELRDRYGIQHFRLVGYSGGGVIAARLAAERNDVMELATIAAPLSLHEWTRRHGVTPLAGRDTLDSAPLLRERGIRNQHWIGQNDRIVTADLVAGFAGRSGGVVREIADFDHECCWSRAWPAMRREMQ
jgi:hypothetical protein